MKPELPLALLQTPPRGWRVWWTAARPRTLTLATAPVIAGTALAWAEGMAHQWPVVLAVLLAALLIQIGTNLHNDATDHECGNDLADRLGPLRVTAAGWATTAQVRKASFAAIATAFLLGIYLAVQGGWPILLIGLASLAAGVAYSGGPRPISHSPFGELFVWIFFGVLAVAGSYWLQAGTLSPAAWIAGAAIGLPASAVLLVNNLRDVISDTRSGRRTLAALLGDARARRLYGLLMLLPFASLPLLTALGLAGAWLALLTLPAALLLVQRIQRTHGPALNVLLARTAQYALGFAICLASGALLF